MKQLVSAISWLFLSTFIFSSSLVYAADFSLLTVDKSGQTVVMQAEIKAPVVYSFDNLQFSTAYKNPVTPGSVLGETVADKDTAPLVLTVPEPSPVPSPSPAITPQPLPTPQPVEPAEPPSPILTAPADLETSFAAAESTYGVSARLLKDIAQCESGMRPNAVNGPYLGMFQFLASTWSSNRRAMGADPDPSLRANGHEAIMTAAYKISRDGIGAWPVCGKKAMAALS